MDRAEVRGLQCSKIMAGLHIAGRSFNPEHAQPIHRGDHSGVIELLATVSRNE